MNLLAELQNRFAAALATLVDDYQPLLEMVRRSTDARFGDYQANCAMPLQGKLGRKSREIAEQIVAALKIDDLCEPPEIAGPGFINLRIKDEVLASQLNEAVADARLGCPTQQPARTYVVDYSAPNVAKPMHIGHIRSTVIGDSLCRVLRFLGHRVIGDNHIGDWGTQFGMIIYGCRYLAEHATEPEGTIGYYAQLYRLTNQLVEYHKGKAEVAAIQHNIEELSAELARAEAAVAAAGADKKALKKAEGDHRRIQNKLAETRQELEDLQAKLAAVDNDPVKSRLAQEHHDIGNRVLLETARLHSGDPENLALWKKILPPCLALLDAMYKRLGVKFDYTLGESFYHDRLERVVHELQEKGLATESEGAVVIFLEGFDTPMLIRKRDGAFLYATTDLATIQYRMEQWKPDAILYVVDHRQSLHFEQLFATARRWGYGDVELKHIGFGTVLGEDGRPIKTRSGWSVDLSDVINEVVAHAAKVVAEADTEGELSPEQRAEVAEVVGVGAIKYFDLSHNRTSDYRFSYEAMLNLRGNTATYMQYAFARCRSILRKAGVDPDTLRASGAKIVLTDPAERALALELARFAEAVAEVPLDYRPNLLTSYLFDQVAKSFSTFFENCPVLKAPSDEVRASRCLLVDLTSKVLKKGLELLGIDVVERL